MKLLRQLIRYIRRCLWWRDARRVESQMRGPVYYDVSAVVARESLPVAILSACRRVL